MAEKKEEEEEIEEIDEEAIRKLAEKAMATYKEAEEEKKPEKKPGLLAKIFKKPVEEAEERPEEPERPEVPAEEEPKKEKWVDVTIELEKVKTKIDAFKDMLTTSNERISAISESVGELRSMVMQVDGAFREISIKMDKLSDDVKNLKPKKIEKMFLKRDETLEKHSSLIELLTKKMKSMTETLAKVEKTLREIGSVENLSKVNKRIKENLDEIKELSGYMERISGKTESMFLDMSKSMEDTARIKAKIDSLDDLTKDLLKATDSLNLKFENFLSKDEAESLKQDIVIIQEQLKSINEVFPVLKAVIPETIINLRNEKKSVISLLESLREDFGEGRISRETYEQARKINEKKLAEIEKKLVEEWKTFEKIAAAKKEEKLEKIEEEKPEKEKKPEEERAEEKEEKPEEKPEVEKEEKAEEKEKKEGEEERPEEKPEEAEEREKEEEEKKPEEIIKEEEIKNKIEEMLKKKLEEI